MREQSGPLILRLVSKLEGGHVCARLFEGYEGFTFQCVGELRWSVEKIGGWQCFGATLGLGEAAMKGRVKVELLGGTEVVEELARREREKEPC